MEKLYEGLSFDDLQYLRNKRRDYIAVSITERTDEMISKLASDWTAIYIPYLESINKHITVHSTSAYYSLSAIESAYPKIDNKDRILSPFTATNYDDEFRITIVHTSTGVKIYEYAKSLTDETIPEDIKWISLPHIEMLLVQNQTHRLKVFRKNNTILVLTNKVNNKLTKELLATFPSLFSITSLQTDTNVTNCLKAVVKNESVAPYFKPILEARINAQKEKINTLLKQALTSNLQTTIRNLEDKIQNTKQYIERYQRDLDGYYEKLQNQLIEKLGIETKMSTTDVENNLTELLTFIQSNKFIKTLSMKEFNAGYGYNENIVLELEAPITLYEEEPLQRQITNLYQHFDEVGIACLDVLAEVFLKDKYQLYCTTLVGLELAYSEIEAQYSDLRVNLSDYSKMPQPHLSYFNCWGDQRSNIRQALRDGNIIDAIQLMLISVQNINFTDTTVLNRWIGKMQSNSYLIQECKCIKDQEGNWYTFKDIMNIISERNKVKTTKEMVGEPGVTQPELIDELEGEE